MARTQQRCPTNKGGKRTRQSALFTVTADCDLGAVAAPWLCAQGADVTIVRADVPDALPRAESSGLAWQCAGDRLLILVPCGIRFLVEGGESIKYSVEDGVGAADLRLFLLGSAWPALAMQRGLLPLHASAVAQNANVEDGNMHAFTGHAGAGKSTLAAALSGRGHPFFADDVVLLDPSRFDAEAACYRFDDLKLWPDGLTLAGATEAGPVREVADFRKRYAVPLRRSPRVNGRLSTLRVLRQSYRPGTPLHDAPLHGRQATTALYKAIHRRPFALAIVGRPRLFGWLTRLLRHVDVFAFHRAMTPARFDEGVAALSQTLAADGRP